MRRVLLLAFIWGWSFLFIKVALRAMTPGMVAFGRIVVGLVVIAVVVRARGLRMPRDLRMWRHFAVMGLIYAALPFTLLAWGEERITSALASVMNAGTPLFAAIAAAVGLGERLRLRQVGGLLLGFFGVSVAAGLGGSDLASSSATGAVAALGTAACYGMGFAYAQRHLVGVPPLVSVFGQLVCGTVLTLPLAAAGVATRGLDLEWRPLVSVLLLGAFATGIAYVLNYQAIAAVGPTRASLVTYVVPVVAVSVGVLFLDEPFRLRLLVGGALVAVGIALLQEPLRRFRRAPIVTALLALVVLGGCGRGDDGGGSRSGSGGGSADDGACGAAVSEPLDPGSTQHLLPGAPEPTYITDPPTSGAHRSGAPPQGVVDQPLERPVQAGVLEGGGVVVQYRDPADAAVLRGLADEQVVVAPNPSLPAPVIATAWRHKVTCTAVDMDALRAFVDDHAGRGTGGGH
ncbi:MAG: EamA family transporter [Actinobacteria bacterium]|nr:EamA family transporter [Actinomycetota bacterium]